MPQVFMRIHPPRDDGSGASVDINFPAALLALFNSFVKSVLGLEKDGDTIVVTRIDGRSPDELLLMMTMKEGKDESA